MRREKSLRIGVHHANAVVCKPVYRTHLAVGDASEPPQRVSAEGRHDAVLVEQARVRPAERGVDDALGHLTYYRGAISLHWSPYDPVGVVNAVS